MRQIKYLGDGVYLNHDGYQFWLAINHHENNVVALESDVFFGLILEGLKYLDQREKEIIISHIN